MSEDCDKIKINDLMLFNSLRLIYTQCNIDQTIPIKIELKEKGNIEIEVLE